MKLIHALLAAIARLASAVGLRQAEVAAETADKAITSVEELAETIGIVHAGADDLVFLATPDTNVGLFNELVAQLLTRLNAYREQGKLLPNVVLLPPGIDIEVVRGAVAQAAAKAATRGAQ